MRRSPPTSRRRLPIGKPFAAVLSLLLLTIVRPGYGASLGIFSGPKTSTSPVVLSPATTLNAAGITFGVQQVVTPASTTLPLFDPTTGALVNINAVKTAPNSIFVITGGNGMGYGSLGTTTFTSNAFDGIMTPRTGILSPSPLPASLGPVPTAGFGGSVGGAASVSAATVNSGTAAYNFFLAPTSVNDTGPATGTASEVFSRAISTFGFSGTSTEVPGVSLAVSGTLGGQGPSGAFVAASLETKFSLYNSAGQLQSTESTAVVIGNATGSTIGSFIASTSSVAGNTLTSGVQRGGTNSFYGFGASLLPTVTIPNGGFVVLDSTLSLVADPDATVIVDVLPLNLTLEDFGATVPVAPEPCSFVMFATGTLGVLGALWRDRKRRKAVC